jgi:hypothetical protein
MWRKVDDRISVREVVEFNLCSSKSVKVDRVNKFPEDKFRFNIGKLTASM